MSTLSPDNRQKRLDELYEYGKSKGTLTYKEIMDRLMELQMDSDQLDRVLETLDAYGVSVDSSRAQTRESQTFLGDPAISPACPSDA